MNDNEPQQQPTQKNSLNLLTQAGVKKFDIKFFAFYVIGGMVLAVITNLVLEGGSMPESRWIFSSLGGLVIGAVLYLWDLNKAKKS